MITVKQILQSYNPYNDISESEKIKSAVHEGLLDEKKIPVLKRALRKEARDITPIEKKVLNESIEALAEMNYLSKFDKRQSAKYSKGDKDAPVVLVLKRKAIRVYPDNQKIALYYSDAIDKYFSIPFGLNSPENISLAESEENEKTMYQKNNINRNFKNKLKQIREEKEQLDEALPIVPAIIAAGARLAPMAYRAAKAASPIAKRVVQRVTSRAKDLAAKAKDALTKKDKPAPSKGGKGGKSTRGKKPTRTNRTLHSRRLRLAAELGLDPTGSRKSDTDKVFDFKALTPGSFSMNPKERVSASQPSVGSRASDAFQQQQNRRIFGESTNLNKIKLLANSKNKTTQITIGESTTTINSRVAKKIMKVYNSLNEENKKKVENMLNENITSFKKIINFAIKA